MINTTNATVRKLANGYLITSQGSNAIPATVYAATLPEVTYWLGRIFAPFP